MSTPKATIETQAPPSRSGIDIPSDLAAALTRRPDVERNFGALPPSHQLEYIEWIVQAKKPATRAARIEKTLMRIAEKAQPR